MTSMTPLVLAVGADGKFAGLVVPELAKRGAHVRGLIRDAGKSEEVRQHGAVDVAIGDLRDRASLDKALDGVVAVFYIAPAFLADEVTVGQGFVQAAKEHGVRRFVFSSVIHPILSALGNHAAKAPVEEAILASDMEYTFLHPTLFFQNLAASWPQILKTGIYAEPWSEDTSFTRVDYRDVAEVAAMALLDDRLLYGTFELCAAGNLNRKEVAALMSEVAGKPIKAAKLNLQANAIPDNDQQLAPMRPMFDWYDTHGLLGNPLTLHAILGHEPRTLRAYLAELIAASQSSAT